MSTTENLAIKIILSFVNSRTSFKRNENGKFTYAVLLIYRTQRNFICPNELSRECVRVHVCVCVCVFV